MGRIGTTELLVILLIAVVLFGGSRVAGQFFFINPRAARYIAADFFAIRGRSFGSSNRIARTTMISNSPNPISMIHTCL